MELSISTSAGFNEDTDAPPGELQGSYLSLNIRGAMLRELDTTYHRYIAAQALSLVYEQLLPEDIDQYDYYRASTYYPVDTVDYEISLNFLPQELAQSAAWIDNGDKITKALKSQDYGTLQALFQNPPSQESIVAFGQKAAPLLATEKIYVGFKLTTTQTGVEAVTLGFISSFPKPRLIMFAEIDPFASKKFITGIQIIE